MQNARNILCFHIPGTLSADLDIRWKAAFDGRVKHISAVASNDSDATLAVGVSTDTDEILSASTIGDSQVPGTFDKDDWASANSAGSFVKDETLVISVDHDGAGGTAAADLTLVITLLEG